MKKRLTTDRIYLIVTGLLIQIALIIPWIPGVEGRYNTYTYLARMHSVDNLVDLVMTDFGFQKTGWFDVADLQPMAVIFRMQLIVLAIVQILGILNILLVFARNKHSFLCVVGSILSAANLFCMPESMMFYLDGWIPKLYLLIILILQGINLIGYRMIDSWAEATEEQRKIRKREREAKRERKERLAFEGKYSQLFYKVIWKNFMVSWETYRLFVLVAGLAVTFIFAGIGMREMLAGTSESARQVVGQGLSGILLNFLVVTIAISVFLIVSVLLFYLKHHVKNYALFLNLGMRSRTLYLFVGIELLSCIVISIIGGSILGNLILVFCRLAIGKAFHGTQVVGGITIKTYLLTLLVSFLVFLVSAMATRDVYIDTGASASRYKDVMKEKMPGRLSPVWMLLGAGIMGYAVCNFARRDRAEGVTLIVLFFMGLYLFWRHAWNLYLKLRKGKDKVYFGSMLKKNYFYHHFKTAFRYVFLITLLHICALFVFSREVVSSVIAEEPETMFPYDYVCMATEDEETFFEEMGNEYGAEVLIVPMVRVSNVDNTSTMHDLRECIQPQGQHIGVSESTYRLLCEKIGRKPRDLDLAEDGKDVFLVYQEDKSVKAHPIDHFLMDHSKPYLHIGQPVTSYNYMIREEIFPPRDVMGEETASLIGNLKQGEHENIVVFSDEYYAKIQEMWKTTMYVTGETIAEDEAVEDVTVHHWPDRLVLLNVEEETKSAIEAQLKIFGDNHAFDEKFDRDVRSWYSKDERISQIKSERFMNIAVSMFIILVMMTVSFVLLYMKVESEMEEKKKQQEFLECMGMREKERLRVIRSEIRYFFWIPFVIATITVIIFTTLMWRIRMYTLADCIAYTKILTVVYLLYMAIQFLEIKYLENYIIRKVGGNHGRNHKN